MLSFVYLCLRKDPTLSRLQTNFHLEKIPDPVLDLRIRILAHQKRLTASCSVSVLQIQDVYPGYGSENFSFRIPDPDAKALFIPDPFSYIKRGKSKKKLRYLFSCSLWFQS
jgi:hypothetical protein